MSLYRAGSGSGGGGQKVVVEGLLTNGFGGAAQFTISGITNIESIVIEEGKLPDASNPSYMSVSTKIDGVVYSVMKMMVSYPNYSKVTDISGNVVSMSSNPSCGKLYYRAIGT